MGVFELVGLAVAGATLVYFLNYLISRPVAATWLILVLLLLTALFDEQLISVEVAGFRIGPSDVGYSLIAGAAFFRLLRVDRTSTTQKALMVLSILTITSLVLGIMEGQIDRAVNEFRTYLGFVAAALYFSTARPVTTMLVRMSRAWLTVGVGLGALVMVRWLARMTGLNLGVLDATDASSGFDATVRVLNGPHTLMLTTAALVLLLPGLEGGTRLYLRERRVGIALLIVSLVLNRRTLWFALGVVLLVVLIRNRKVGLRIAALGFAGLTLFAAALPLFQRAPDPTEPVAQSITNPDTLVWRFEGWLALLDSGPDSPDEVVLGLPFGTGYSRFIAGAERVSGPHNFYMQTYLRTGLLGLAALVAALVLSLASISTAVDDETHPFASRHLFLLLMILSLWMLTWTPLADQGIILGLAVASAARRDGTTPVDPGVRLPRLSNGLGRRSTRPAISPWTTRA